MSFGRSSLPNTCQKPFSYDHPSFTPTCRCTLFYLLQTFVLKTLLSAHAHFHKVWTVVCVCGFETNMLMACLEQAVVCRVIYRINYNNILFHPCRGHGNLFLTDYAQCFMSVSHRSEMYLCVSGWQGSLVLYVFLKNILKLIKIKLYDGYWVDIKSILFVILCFSSSSSLLTVLVSAASSPD